MPALRPPPGELVEEVRVTVAGENERVERSATAGGTVSPRPRRPRRDTAQVERDARLAELVAGLTGSPLGGALHAVVHDDGPQTADALEVVARAIIKVDQPPPKELRLERAEREQRVDAVPSSGDDDDSGGDDEAPDAP